MGLLTKIWPWSEIARLREERDTWVSFHDQAADYAHQVEAQLNAAQRREDLRLAMRRDRDRRRRSATNADMIAKLRSEQVKL